MAVLGQKIYSLSRQRAQSLVFGAGFLVIGYVPAVAHLVSFWVPAGMHAIVLRPEAGSAEALRPEAASAKILAPSNGVAIVAGP
jgi:hypothetical protein